MKVLKRCLLFLLIAFIIYVGHDIYLKLIKDNLPSDYAMYLGTHNSVINIATTPQTPNITNSLLQLEESSNTSAVSHEAYHFYYKQLDKEAKIIYHELEVNIPNLKKPNYKIDFSTQFNTLLHEAKGATHLEKSFQSAIDAFSYDHPELFYIDLSKVSFLTRSETFMGTTTYRVSITPQSSTYLADQFLNSSDLNNAIAQVESMRNSFVNGVSGDNYQKVLQVHDTLVNLLSYDTTYHRPNTHNIYGALVEKNVVCEGYAKSFKYILDGLNIPCILVSGNATNSNGNTESHMWNYVQLNGKWYGVDATWDDPIIVGSHTRQNTIQHSYFCKGLSIFDRSHIPNGRLSDSGVKFSYPTLNADNY